MLHNLVAMQQELRDVNSDLDRKVDELAQANMALYEMNRLKSDFLATMSHELRTPLNSIIGFSRGPASASDAAQRPAAAVREQHPVVGQDAPGDDQRHPRPGQDRERQDGGPDRGLLDPRRLRGASSPISGPIAERKNIDLECRLDEAIPLLRQDPGKLRQILYNLLSNAIKFTPEGGRVTAPAQPTEGGSSFEVADTGIGIAEEDREQIFEKFRQVGHNSVLTREHQGTGLGLSISKELAKLLGGDINLVSEVGRGTQLLLFACPFTWKTPLSRWASSAAMPPTLSSRHWQEPQVVRSQVQHSYTELPGEVHTPGLTRRMDPCRSSIAVCECPVSR